MQTKILVIIQDGKTTIYPPSAADQISIVNFDRGDPIPTHFRNQKHVR